MTHKFFTTILFISAACLIIMPATTVYSMVVPSPIPNLKEGAVCEYSNGEIVGDCESPLVCEPEYAGEQGMISNKICKKETQYTYTGEATKLCEFVKDDQIKYKDCKKCILAGKAWTAIGCLSTDPTEFIRDLLSFGSGIAGGIAFLLILFGGLQIMMSSGNPEKMQAGKELVGSAVSGLLLIIFSVFLLRFVGVDILGIPTLTR